MSHVASIELQILDLDALSAACESLGLELCKNQRTYNWYGRSVGDTPLPAGFTRDDLGKCEHVIRMKGTAMNGQIDARMPYEIGIVARRDGKPGYALMWDTYKGGGGLVEKVGGEKAERLCQGYAVETAVRIAKRQGFRVVKREVRSDGSISIVTER